MNRWELPTAVTRRQVTESADGFHLVYTRSEREGDDIDRKKFSPQLSPPVLKIAPEQGAPGTEMSGEMLISTPPRRISNSTRAASGDIN